MLILPSCSGEYRDESLLAHARRRDGSDCRTGQWRRRRVAELRAIFKFHQSTLPTSQPKTHLIDLRMSTTSLLSPLALTVASDRRQCLQQPYSLPTSRLPHLCHREASESSQADLSGRIFQRRHQLAPPTRCSANQAAADEHNAAGRSVPEPEDPTAKVGLWSKWKANTSAMRSKLAKLGLAAVLAYGLFDGVTYTTFFVLAFLGYEKSTGKNPAANLQALLGIVILMWTGNNVTKPFRVAGAAALAPAVDEGLKAVQKHLKLRNQVYAFAFVVGAVAVTCLSIVGVLILSRWGK